MSSSEKPQTKSKNSAITKPSVYTDDIDDDENRCGYCSWRPNWLQKCNTPRFLLACLSWFTFTQGFVVNGIVYTNFTSLERRYGYTGAQIAWISGSYELMAAILTLLFGYIGQWMHNGKILCIGAYCISIGSFLMSLPHFISGEYRLGPREIEVCDLLNVNETSSYCEEGSSSSYYVYFIIAQCFHAVGGAAVYTLGIPYVDDQIKSKNTPIYIGIMQGNAAFGPALGYILGGFFLSIYVDANKGIEVDIDPLDPRWVGAWWIGLLISGFCALTVAFFMGCFPKELPSAKKYKSERKSQAYRQTKVMDKSKDATKSHDSFLYSCKVIFTNPIWILITISGVVEGAGVAGFSAFLPKVLQFQFAQPPGLGAAIAGLVIVPGAVGGQILGGIFPKCLKLGMRGLLLQSAICSFIALALSFQFLLRCETMPIAGITAPYFNGTLDEVSVVHPCNEPCNCTTESYDPVCGSDDIEYFSPCHGGCLGSYDEDGYTVYTYCMCINLDNVTGPPGWAVTSTCESDCNEFGPFLIFFLLMNLATFMSFTSGSAINIRCVPHKQRSLANGLTRFIARLLGEVPGVVVFGYVFDYTCYLFQESCGETGSCWVYDTEFVSEYMFYACVVIKGTSTLCFLIGYCIYKPTEDEQTLLEMTAEVKINKKNYISDNDSYVSELSQNTFM